MVVLFTWAWRQGSLPTRAFAVGMGDLLFVVVFLVFLATSPTRRMTAAPGDGHLRRRRARSPAHCDLIDLHVDTLIPPRLWRYDPLVRHRGGPLGRHFFGHLDLPRLSDGGLDGAMWSITTNPFRSAAGRWRAFQQNLQALRTWSRDRPGGWWRCTPPAEYREARRRGAHAVLPAIQGLNALEGAPDGVGSIPDGIVRATLVHLTNAVYGATSSPLGAGARTRA